MSSIDRVCSIENCYKPSKYITAELCSMHGERNRRTGSPLVVKNHHEWNGLKHSAIYNTWAGIVKRCTSVNDKAYLRYGAKGIKVCAGWRYSPSKFYKDMGDKPVDYSIDRKNGNGNYSCGSCAECLINKWPMNCRWTTGSIQNWNKGKMRTNTSGYIGVIRKAKLRTRPWQARITSSETGKKVKWSLGFYTTPEEAAIAYDIACIFLRGEEAKTNIL